MNKSKLERDVARLRSSIERELFGRKSALPDQHEVCSQFSTKSVVKESLEGYGVYFVIASFVAYDCLDK